MKQKLAIVILALAVLGGAGAWYLVDPLPASSLTQLDADSFAQFRNDFNAAAGKVRVIALLSPT